jgi:hypothetical protein
VEQWESGADPNVRLQKGTVHRVIEMLGLDVTPQEGMIFDRAGRLPVDREFFDIWDLQGAF